MEKEPIINKKDLEIQSNIFSEGYGIFPNKILHDEKISSFSKLLYCEISSLCAQRGYCWATNQYFAKSFKVSVSTVVRAMQELQQYLTIKNSQSSQRIIFVQTSMKKNKTKVKEVVEKEEVQPVKVKAIEKPKYTQDDLFLAELLLQKIIYNLPTFENKKVKIADWSDEIRKLREIEKANFEQIKFIITWIHGGDYAFAGRPSKYYQPNEFWEKNILSASKLRKQWFTLVKQMQSDIKTTQKKSTVTQL